MPCAPTGTTWPYRGVDNDAGKIARAQQRGATSGLARGAFDVVDLARGPPGASRQRRDPRRAAVPRRRRRSAALLDDAIGDADAGRAAGHPHRPGRRQPARPHHPRRSMRSRARAGLDATPGRSAIPMPKACARSFDAAGLQTAVRAAVRQHAVQQLADRGDEGVSRVGAPLGRESRLPVTSRSGIALQAARSYSSSGSTRAVAVRLQPLQQQRDHLDVAAVPRAFVQQHDRARRKVALDARDHRLRIGSATRRSRARSTPRAPGRARAAARTRRDWPCRPPRGTSAASCPVSSRSVAWACAISRAHPPRPQRPEPGLRVGLAVIADAVAASHDLAHQFRSRRGAVADQEERGLRADARSSRSSIAAGVVGRAVVDRQPDARLRRSASGVSTGLNSRECGFRTPHRNTSAWPPAPAGRCASRSATRSPPPVATAAAPSTRRAGGAARGAARGVAWPHDAMHRDAPEPRRSRGSWTPNQIVPNSTGFGFCSSFPRRRESSDHDFE